MKVQTAAVPASFRGSKNAHSALLALAMAMNWAVAEAAAFHVGNCEEEDDEEAAAFAEYQKRMGQNHAQQAVHKNSAAAMSAEHNKMREQERRRREEQLTKERQENSQSACMIGRQYGLPTEVSSEILTRVGEPSGTRTFAHSRTQHHLTELEHARREKLRAGVLALDKRVDAYTNELAGNKGAVDSRRWEHLQTVSSAQEAIRGNTALHGREDKEFVQMFR